jgi:hypothetical protein
MCFDVMEFGAGEVNFDYVMIVLVMLVLVMLEKSDLGYEIFVF